MRQLGALCALVLVIAASCARGEPAPSPAPRLDRGDLQGALLDSEAVGAEWRAKENPGPNTLQIGDRVGAANIRPTLAEATSAFDQGEESALFISNTILLLRAEAMARAVITAHRDAASTQSWTQERDDGGTGEFTLVGGVAGLPELGDAMYAARLRAVVIGPDEQRSEHDIEYVVFTVGHLVAFVVTQDVAAGPLARRLEGRVARLATAGNQEK